MNQLGLISPLNALEGGMELPLEHHSPHFYIRHIA
jgi:hypothetical protein